MIKTKCKIKFNRHASNESKVETGLRYETNKKFYKNQIF